MTSLLVATSSLWMLKTLKNASRSLRKTLLQIFERACWEKPQEKLMVLRKLS